MTFQLTDALRYSEEAHEHIWSQIHGTKFPGDDRSFLALTYVSVALEHQTSIRKLIEMNLRGSAAALLRSQVEAVVRGLLFKTTHFIWTDPRNATQIGATSALA